MNANEHQIQTTKKNNIEDPDPSGINSIVIPAEAGTIASIWHR